MPADRPQIKPGLRRLRRGPGTLQLGLTPDAGVVLDGLAEGELQLLERLDGTHRLDDLSAWARAQGLDGERVRRLLDLLAGAGVLTGAPTDRAHLHQLGPMRPQLLPDATAWSVVYPDAGDGFELLSQRGRRRALLVGRGRLAEAAGAAVARTGVDLTHRDVLGPVSDRAGEARGRADPAYGLVLLVGDDAVGTAAAAALLGAQLDHLAVVAGVDRATVGPLVVPGRSACLRCLELHRTDRDPAWPAISAQLDRPAPAARGESSLLALCAALVALQVACWADGRRRPASLGATLTATLPDGLTSRRPWPMHPRCGCGWLAASLPVDQDAARSVADRPRAAADRRQ